MSSPRDDVVDWAEEVQLPSGKEIEGSERESDHVSEGVPAGDEQLDDAVVAKMARETIGTSISLNDSISALYGKATSWADEPVQESAAGPAPESPKLQCEPGTHRPLLGEPYTSLDRTRFSHPITPVPKQSSLSMVLSDIPDDNLSIRTTLVEFSAKLAELQEKNTRLEAENKRLHDRLRTQTKILENVGKTLDSHNNQLAGLMKEQNGLSRELDERITAVSDDFKTRLANTVEIHKETPELVERLVTATHQVLSLLPEDVATRMKEVVLPAREKEVLQQINTTLAVPARKTKRIPPKWRK